MEPLPQVRTANRTVAALTSSFCAPPGTRVVHAELNPLPSSSRPRSLPGSRSAASPFKTGGGDSALLNAAILNCEKRRENKKREVQAGPGRQGAPEARGHRRTSGRTEQEWTRFRAQQTLGTATEGRHDNDPPGCKDLGLKSCGCCWFNPKHG